MSANFENGDNMIGVLLGFQIEDERWKAKHSERSRSKNSALEARRRAVAQNLLRRPSREAEIVGQLIEKALDAGRCFESAQRPQFRARKTGTRQRRCRSCSCSVQGTKSHHATSKQTPIIQIPTTRFASDLGKIGASNFPGVWNLRFGILATTASSWLTVPPGVLLRTHVASDRLFASEAPIDKSSYPRAWYRGVARQ